MGLKKCNRALLGNNAPRPLRLVLDYMENVNPGKGHHGQHDSGVERYRLLAVAGGRTISCERFPVSRRPIHTLSQIMGRQSVQKTASSEWNKVRHKGWRPARALARSVRCGQTMASAIKVPRLRSEETANNRPMKIGRCPFRDVSLHGGRAQGFDRVREHAQAVRVQRHDQQIEQQNKCRLR